MITPMVPVMGTAVVVVMQVVWLLVAGVELPMAMVCWLPVAMERSVEASMVLFLLVVELMEMERPLVEEALEKLGQRVTR
jgi:hypothetical protein